MASTITTPVINPNTPVWIPSEAEIEATHIAELMRELRISSYLELHRWSITHRSEFWNRVIQDLGIRFRQPYTQIVDLSKGVEIPQWLVNSRLNIVESCFKSDETAIAIVSQSEGQALSKMTYGELHRLTNRVSNGLVMAGYQPGDAIAIVMPMTAESVAIYLGIIQAGYVAVAIADSFSASEIATRLHLVNPKAIVTQDHIWRGGKSFPLYTKLIDAHAPRAIVVRSSRSATLELRQGDCTWTEFLSANEQFDALAATPETHTTLLFSSGTTGTPKAIPWTHTTPIKCAMDGHFHQDIHPTDVIAWPTNLGWMMGPWLIYAGLINGAAIALYDGTPTQREFGLFVQRAEVTVLGVIPSLVRCWKRTGCMESLDWHRIRVFSSTGECSNPQDMHYLIGLAGNKPVIEYCGGTEIGGGYLTGTLVQPAIPSTFTTPALGTDIVILDENHNVSDNGEAWIIPPAIGLSTELIGHDHHQIYFADTPDVPSLSSPLRRHGDQFERLPNGYYRAQGRTDDTMNLGGIKVSAVEIEQILNQVEGIRETAAIAIAPPDGGPSQLVIYAVIESTCTQAEAALFTTLQSVIQTQLNPLFKIHTLMIVATLPRTASHKVMRRALRDHC